MEQRKIIEEYYIELYNVYLKKNFNFFVEKCLNYNININFYKKNISEISKKIFNSIMLETQENKRKIDYHEFNFFYKMSVKNINNDNKLIFDNNIIIDIPVFEENYEKISMILIKFLLKNNIEFTVKLYKIIKNSYFQIVLKSTNDAKKLIDYFNIDEEIKKEVKSRSLPFLYQKNLLGIYTEYKPYSFKNFYIKNLYEYFSTLNDIEEISMESFMNYIYELYKKEVNINKKRMYLLLFEYIKSMFDDSDIFQIFDRNIIMSIGGYESNDFNIKLDNNKHIFFYNKIDNTEIKYGDEDFLKIAYSKYYDNVIKQDKSDKYYNFFYNVYDNIISSNYNNLNLIMTLANNNMDIINKELIILSSAYFSNIKMSIPIKIVYIMLDKILNIKQNTIKIEKKENIINYYILNNNYGNKIITLKNHSITSMKKYIESNNIIKSIPVDSIIYLKNGKIQSGKEFIDNLYIYIPQYNTYDELFKELVDYIEYK